MTELRLTDATYTERLTSFLESLGQNVVVSGPGAVELSPSESEGAQVEIGLYVRVWNVLHPDAQVTIAP